jgi:hypothetical protein
MPKTDKRAKRKKRLAKKEARRAKRLEAKRREGEAPLSANFVRRVVRRHAPVLEEIQAALLAAADEDERVDDWTVYQALKAHLTHRDPTSERVDAVFELIEDVYEDCVDIEDDQWDDCLRVLMNVIRNRSNMAPGETDYLEWLKELFGDERDPFDDEEW